MDIIEELKKFVENSNECAKSAKEMMDKAAEEGNYYKAGEMQVAESLHSMFAMRIQRIIDGKAAFVETKNAEVVS